MVYAGLFNIGFGLVAVSFTIVVTRRLDVSDASRALVSWNVLTIIGAVTQQPAEVYAPRLGFEVRSAGGRASDVRRSINFIVLVGTGVSCVLAILLWMLLDRLGIGVLGLLFAGVAFGMSYSHRARLVARGDFGVLAVTAGVTGATGLLLALLVTHELPVESPDKILMIVLLAFLVPTIVEIADGRDRDSRGGRSKSWIPPVPRRRMLSMAASLGATSAVSLVLFAGGAPVGAFIGMPDEQLTSYAVTASVAAVPSIMWASAMLPILNRAVESIERNDWRDLRSVFTRTLTLGLGIVPMMTLSSVLVGPSLLRVYMGSEVSLSRVEIGFVFLAAGVTAVSNIPRLVLTGMGIALRFNRWLAVVSVSYVGFLWAGASLPPFWRVTGAAFLAGSMLTAIGAVVVFRQSRDTAVILK